MSFLNSEALLDLLIKEQLLTTEQRQFIILQKGKQRQKLLKQVGGRRQEDEQKPDRGYPDLVDVIVSLQIETGLAPKTPLTEEMIMRAVSHGLKIPFKKLDPLELDMDTVTKTIPRSFAVNHLILPLELNNGILEVVTYHPDNHHVFEDIERANQVTVRPYLSTRTDIKKILAEFFGFQRSITAAESQFGDSGRVIRRDAFTPRYLYWGFVRVFGGMAHHFTRWKRSYRGSRVPLNPTVPVATTRAP